MLGKRKERNSMLQEIMTLGLYDYLFLVFEITLEFTLNSKNLFSDIDDKRAYSHLWENGKINASYMWVSQDSFPPITGKLSSPKD